MRKPVVDMLFVRSFAIEVNESLSFSSLPTWKKRFISGNASYIPSSTAISTKKEEIW